MVTGQEAELRGGTRGASRAHPVGAQGAWGAGPGSPGPSRGGGAEAGKEFTVESVSKGCRESEFKRETNCNGC